MINNLMDFEMLIMFICIYTGATNFTNQCDDHQNGREMHGNSNDSSKCNVKGVNCTPTEAGHSLHRGSCQFSSGVSRKG